MMGMLHAEPEPILAAALARDPFDLMIHRSIRKCMHHHPSLLSFISHCVSPALLPNGSLQKVYSNLLLLRICPRCLFWRGAAAAG
jgi:hypothetical protein